MYKKIISIMSVMLVVFLCFNYDVKADEVIDSSRRYNWLSTTQHYGNVDVTGNLFCLSDNPAMQSVNLSSAEYVGGGTTTNIVSTWESVYLWKFQATYVIKNNSQTYETFDNGRLYSQFSVNAKASTSASGSGTLHDDIVPSGWYIDNIQGATLTNALSDGTMYWSVDHTYYGNTLIIAPGETITFSYDINIFWWEQSFGVGGTTFACNNGSISNTIGYTQQDGYNSYSVYEFITDQPFPSVDQYIADNINSIWTLVTRLANNQLITNQNLEDIISALTYSGNYPSVSGSNSYFTNTSTVKNDGIVVYSNAYMQKGLFEDSYVYIDTSNDTYYNYYSISYDVNYIIRINNPNNYDITIGNNNISLRVNDDFVLDNYIGDIQVQRNSINYLLLMNIVVPANSNKFIFIKGHINYIGSNPNYSPSLNNILSSGNFSIYDPNNSENTTIDNQHDIESSYFDDSQTSITDTGIQNFQFDSNTLGGLGGIKDDFTAVWIACGSLSQYWIASLTIGLALSIIRHRRMFEK